MTGEWSKKIANFSRCTSMTGTLIAVSVTLLPCSAFAKGGKGKSQIRTDLAASSMVYNDFNASESKGTTGTISKEKLSGSRFAMSMNLRDLVFEFSTTQLKPVNSDYWNSRTEQRFGGGYIHPKVRFVSLDLSYFRLAQTGDESDASAPAAMIKNNTYLEFGPAVATPKISFKKVHGVVARGHYKYLTTLEKNRNFGTESSMGFSYLYKLGPADIGISLNRAHHFFNAEREDPDADGYMRKVRSKLIADTIGLQVVFHPQFL